METSTQPQAPKAIRGRCPKCSNALPLNPAGWFDLCVTPGCLTT